MTREPVQTPDMPDADAALPRSNTADAPKAAIHQTLFAADGWVQIGRASCRERV